MFFGRCVRMNKVDPTVWKETKYIAAWVLILSALMQAVFLIIDKWDYSVLLGNLLSAAVSVLNFFLMGLSIQKALQKDEKEAKNTLKLSQTYRTILLLIVAVLGGVLSCFNLWAVLIPMLFPRIAIVFRPMFDKNKT